MNFGVPGFEILRLLGRGGMGEVYLARRTRDGHHAALKVAGKFLGEQGVDRLKREAELLSRISSPHLPKFFGLQEVEGRYVLGMEFVAGTPLEPEAAFDQDVATRIGLVRRVLPGLGAGLLALHEAGIIHRDIKPANCLDAGDRGGVVVDLGLATGPQVQTLTATGVSVGTPDFLTPEQISGEPVTASSDVYQLAMVVQALLLGSVRRPGENPIQAAVRRSVRRPQSLKQEAPWVPQSIDTWLVNAMHPDPSSRPDARSHLQALPGLCAKLVAEAREGIRDPSWFATSGAAELAQARSHARKSGWTAEATADESIWQDLARWEANATSLSVPPTGVAIAGSPTPTINTVEPPPQKNAISKGLITSLAILGLGLGILLGSRLPRTASSPSTNLSFELLNGRIALQGTGTPASTAMLQNAAFAWASDGRLSRPVPPEGKLTLPTQPEPIELLIPQIEKLTVEGSNEIFWFKVDTANSYSRRTKLGFESPATSVEGSSELYFPIDQRLLMRESAKLSFEVAPMIWAERVISFSEVAKSMLKDVDIPQPTFLSTGKIDLSKRSGPGFSYRQLCALMSLQSLDEEERQLIYDQLIPFALAEYSLRNISHTHGSLARIALGTQLSMLDGLSDATSDSGSLDVNIEALNLDLRVGPNADQKRLLGSLPAPRRELGFFDEEGFFRTAFPDVLAQGVDTVELWVHAEDTGENCALEIKFGSHRVVIHLAGRQIQAGTHLPRSWFLDTVGNGSSFEFGFKVIPQPGYIPPSNVLVKYFQLRTLQENGRKRP